MTITDQVFQKIAELSISNFFITVEFSKIGKEMPDQLDIFLLEKHKLILQGASGRKFIYKRDDWRLILTFFPTNEIVNERYALKNKMWIK